MDWKELAKNQESLTKEIKKTGLHFNFKTYFLICIRKEDIFESVIKEPKLSDCRGCRPGEIGFAFHRASRYKEDSVPL